jgi:dsDNA-specific endonuclease/ATPase MutS2
MMNIKVLAISMLLGLSLLFGACAKQAVESPDAVDGAVQEGVESVQQGAEDAGGAVEGGVKDMQDGAKNVTDTAGDAVKEGMDDAKQSTEDAVKEGMDGVKQGTEDAGNAIKDMGDKIPSTEGQ